MGGRNMSLTELLPAVRALGPEDKVKLLQTLTEELSSGDIPGGLKPGAICTISPYDAHDAARALQRMLDEGSD